MDKLLSSFWHLITEVIECQIHIIGEKVSDLLAIDERH